MADSTQNTVVEFTGDFSAPQMPKEVAKAILSVIKACGILEKEDENKFDNYDYASIDSFMKHVREHCCDAGLAIIPQEAAEPRLIETKTKSGSPLMMWWSRFGFVLFHESGATYGPIYKTVMVQAKGAQAAGSAQSYALKQLMRGLFLIPTGDEDDPDKTSAEISSVGEQKTDFQKEAQRIRNAFLKAKDLDALQEKWAVNEIRIEEIQEVSERAHKALCDAYGKREKELKDA